MRRKAQGIPKEVAGPAEKQEQEELRKEPPSKGTMPTGRPRPSDNTPDPSRGPVGIDRVDVMPALRWPWFPRRRGDRPSSRASRVWADAVPPHCILKEFYSQHTFPIPGRPRAGTKQTKRARKKLPKPKPEGDGKRSPATKAKDPETARETRQEYEQARNRTPERRAYRLRHAEEQRQRAKLLGKCQKCSKTAIPGETRCPTCAEANRQSRRRSDARRRDAARQAATTDKADQWARNADEWNEQRPVPGNRPTRPKKGRYARYRLKGCTLAVLTRTTSAPVRTR